MDWLPELLEFDGNWTDYVEKVFAVFERDFIKSKASFRGKEIRLRWMPKYDNKPNAFWHLVQEGKNEEDRTPDLQRCARIAWLRAIIDHSNDACVKVWENERNGNQNVLLWLDEENFLIVLSKRNDYFLLVTAYPTDPEHTRRKLLKEYNAYIADSS